jgi:hypothetical protein
VIVHGFFLLGICFLTATAYPCPPDIYQLLAASKKTSVISESETQPPKRIKEARLARLRLFADYINREKNPEDGWHLTKPRGIHRLTVNLGPPAYTFEDRKQIRSYLAKAKREGQNSPDKALAIQKLFSGLLVQEGAIYLRALNELVNAEEALRKALNHPLKEEKRLRLEAEIQGAEAREKNLRANFVGKTLELMEASNYDPVNLTPNDIDYLEKVYWELSHRWATENGIKTDPDQQAPQHLYTSVRVLAGELTDLGKFTAKIDKLGEANEGQGVHSGVYFSPKTWLQEPRMVAADIFGRVFLRPEIFLEPISKNPEAKYALAMLRDLAHRKKHDSAFEGESRIVTDSGRISLLVEESEGTSFYFKPGLQNYVRALAETFAGETSPKARLSIANEIFRISAARNLEAKHVAIQVDITDVMLSRLEKSFAENAFDVERWRVESLELINDSYGMPLRSLVVRADNGSALPFSPILGVGFLGIAKFPEFHYGRKTSSPRYRQFADRLKRLTDVQDQSIDLTPDEKTALIEAVRELRKDLDVITHYSHTIQRDYESIRSAAYGYLENPNGDTAEKMHAAAKALDDIAQSRRKTRSRSAGKAGSEALILDNSITPPPVLPSTFARWKATRAGATKSEAAQATERMGVESLVHYGQRQNWVARDQGHHKFGYDVMLFDPAQNKQLYVEVKTVNSVNGQITLSNNEIEFARQKMVDGNWVLALVVIDEHGQSKLYLRDQIELGPPLTGGTAGRPYPVTDIISYGRAFDLPIASPGNNRIQSWARE